MPGVEFRANDSGYELTALAGEAERSPADAELGRMRQLIHDLRNPVGSMSMAVEMLLGPLTEGIECMPPELARRVRGTLEAMSESAQQMRYLVSDLNGLAAGTHEVAPGQVASEHPEVVGAANIAPADPAPSINPSTLVPAPATRPRATHLEISDILRRLEILTVTRSALPSLLAVDAPEGLWVEANGPELLRALSNLVENAVEASARAGEGMGPWTVDVRAYAREGEVRIEVHNRGPALPASVMAYLEHDPASGAHAPDAPLSSKKDAGLHGVGLGVVKRVATAYEGRVSGCSAAGITVVCLALPAVEAPKNTGDDEPEEASEGCDVAGSRRPVLAVI